MWFSPQKQHRTVRGKRRESIAPSFLLVAECRSTNWSWTIWSLRPAKELWVISKQVSGQMEKQDRWVQSPDQSPTTYGTYGQRFQRQTGQRAAAQTWLKHPKEQSVLAYHTFRSGSPGAVKGAESSINSLTQVNRRTLSEEGAAETIYMCELNGGFYI